MVSQSLLFYIFPSGYSLIQRFIGTQSFPLPGLKLCGRKSFLKKRQVLDEISQVDQKTD